MYLGLFVIALAATIPFIQAEAAPMTQKQIGIIIETTLQKSGKLNYSDLWYLDRSNKFVSGEIINDSRSCAKVKNSLNWYSLNRPNNLTIIVDPCFSQKTYIPTITIASQLNHYMKFDQMRITELKNSTDAKAIHDTRTISHTRSVDAKCDRAVIGYSPNWKNILHDTINYLSHGCHPDHTKINTIKTENRTITKHDIATSSKWKLDQWQKMIKEECLKKRNACNISNPAVTTNGDSK